MAGIIITVAQQKGGAGKTTLAAHLAVAVKDIGGNQVAVLDVDPQGSLGEWYELREASLGEEDTGICFRTASGWGARREARALARDFEFVIIDTPPHAERESRPAMEAADLVVVPVQPTPVDCWATEPTLEMAQGQGTPAVLVLNRVPSRARLTAEIEKILAGYETQIARNRLGNRVAFAAAVGLGATVNETQPRSKAAAEISGLATELMQLVTQ